MGRQEVACVRRSRLARAGLVLGLAGSVVLPQPTLAEGSGGQRSPARDIQRPASGARDGGLEVFTLSNGVTLLVQPVPGVASVAIQEVHPLGMIHDPAGVTQGNHLVEHLRCMGATESFPAGESFSLLNTMGLGNAETMGDVTHYDLVVPRDSLGEAFTIIAERLDSLRIDEALIAQEAPRCAAEVDGVMRATGSPGLKFALAGAAQHWRHGRTTVSLSGELGGWSADDARAFLEYTHDPAGMIVVVAGDVRPEDVRNLAEAALGHLQARAEAPPAPAPPIDFGAVPRVGVVSWDVPASCVFVAYPPPTEARDRLVLTLWSSAALGSLYPQLATRFEQPMLSHVNYPVGDMPLFAFAGTRGADPARVGAALAEQVEQLAGSHDAGCGLARQQASMLLESLDRRLDGATVNTMVATLSAQFGRARAEHLAVGNFALQLGLAWHALGPVPRERLREVLDLSPEQWRATVREHVNAERRIVTTLTPATPEP